MTNPANTLDNATNSTATVQAARRSLPTGLLATIIGFRHSSAMSEQIVIMRKDGTLASFTAIPLHVIDPYSNTLNAQRTIWVAVNNNSNLSTTGAGDQVFRNTAAGMIRLFLTPKIDKAINPYNALMVQNAEIQQALLPRIDKGNAKSQAMYNLFMKQVNAILEAQDQDENIAKESLKELYTKYQAFRNKLYEEGELEVSQLLVTDTVMPVFAPTPVMSHSSNTFVDFQSLAKTFDFTYAPNINTVFGMIRTNTNEAPAESGMTTGRRAIDKGQNTRFATSTMAMNDNGAEVLATILDLPYNNSKGNKVENTRSVVFERVTEKPTEMFVQGTLKPLVAVAGNGSGLNGHSLFNIEVETYVQHESLNSGMSLYATSIAAALDDDFASQFDFSQSLDDIQAAKTEPVLSQEQSNQPAAADYDLPI